MLSFGVSPTFFIFISAKCGSGIPCVFPVTMDLGVAVKCFFLSGTVHTDRNTAGEEGAQGSGKGPECSLPEMEKYSAGKDLLAEPACPQLSLSLSLFILHRIEHPVSDTGFL